MMRIVPGDLGDPRVIDLLRLHLTRARAETAPGSAHALDLTGLMSPGISFWTIWDDEALVGFGALRRLSADHGEVKSDATPSKRCAARGLAVRCCATLLGLRVLRRCHASAWKRVPRTIFAPRGPSIVSTALSNVRRLAITRPTRTAFHDNRPPEELTGDRRSRFEAAGPQRCGPSLIPCKPPWCHH
jgi:hypothetical protein